MGRENKKEAVAALHRERIMAAAETLFLEKGFVFTTMDDISKNSEYSRRTIYSYYESKEDILYHLIEKGLAVLKHEIKAALCEGDDFISSYSMLCKAFQRYQQQSPSSVDSVLKAKPGSRADRDVPKVVERIYALGDEINGLLEDFLENAKKQGVVRSEANVKASVYIMWSSITSLLSLAETKEAVIPGQLGMTGEEFLAYGFRQIINSLLAEQI